MSKLAWIHLSDWHQKGEEFDRVVVRDNLLKDIANRERIDSSLRNIDFCIFTGDLAFHGDRKEFVTAFSEFVEPVLDAMSLPKSRFFLVPGNHDQDRRHLDVLPSDLHKLVTQREVINEWFGDLRRRRALLGPFENLIEAASEFYEGAPGPDFLFGGLAWIELPGGAFRTALLRLNTAMLCAQHKENGEVKDRGYLAISERQYYERLEEAASSADLILAAMHHPFDWLQDDDRVIAEQRLVEKCDFILFGHNHTPRAIIIDAGQGTACVVHGGTAYERRIPSDPRYACSYNYVVVDLESGLVKIFLRRYSDQQGWVADTEALPPHNLGQRIFTHPRLLEKIRARRDEDESGQPIDVKVVGPRRQLEEQQVGGQLKDLGSLYFVPPPRPTALIGRDREIAVVEGLLPNNRIVVLEGIAGVGKSELGAVIAEHLKESGYITLWLECKPNFSLERFDLALNDFAASLPKNLPLTSLMSDKRPIEQKLPDVIEALNRSRAALFFDDFHIALDDEMVPLLASWIKWAKVARLIIMTREKTASLRHHMGKIGEYLLQGVAREYRIDLIRRYNLIISDSTLEAKVAEKLDGHPLATALFASLVVNEGFGPLDLLDEYRGVFGEELHRRLFADVYKALKPKERKMLGSLSVFRGPVERSGVLRLFHATSRERPEAILRSLQDRFLIRVDPDQTLRTHPLIREFCYSQTIEQEAERGYHADAARFFLPSEKKFIPEKTERYLEAHYHWVRGGWHEKALRIVVLSEEYLYSEGYNHQLLGMYSAAERGGRSLGFWSRIYRIRIHERIGEIDKCQAELEAMKWPKDENHRAILLTQLGNFFYDRDQYENSLRYHEQALTIDESLGRKQGQITDRINIGIVKKIVGKYEEAIEHLQASRELANRIGDRVPEIRAQTIEQEILRLLRRLPFQELQTTRQMALEIYAEEKEHVFRIQGLLDLGGEDRISEALHIAERLGDVAWSVVTRVRQTAATEQTFEERLADFNFALGQARRLKSPSLESSILQDLADFYEEAEKPDEAIRKLEEAIAIERKIGRPLPLSVRLKALSQIHKSYDDPETAEKLFEEAIQILESIGLDKLAGEWRERWSPEAQNRE